MTHPTATRSLGVIARTARIVTGLILLAFVSTHLLNASLGIISLEAMDQARPYLTEFWSVPPLGPILALSLLVHFALGLWSVYQRPTLYVNAQDAVQIATALLVVPLMATHVIGIMMVSNAGFDLDYAGTIRLMWIDSPGIGLLQIIVVTVVWLHGCAGLLTWLRSMERARNVVLWVYPIAIAIPVLSLLGFSEAGRVVLEAAADATVPETTPTQAPQSDMPMPDFALIKSVTNWVICGSLGLAALTLVARALRQQFRAKAQVILIRDGRTLAPVRSGVSLLDGFRLRNEPHASLCQGRGRCGTCAVRVLSSSQPLPEASPLERRTLEQKNLPSDARLACQLAPQGGQITVTALFPPDYAFDSVDAAEVST